MTHNFDKIYIIHLNKNFERKQKCFINLNNNQLINYKFIEAIDTTTDHTYDVLYNNTIQQFPINYTKTNFSRGALGCLLSHINCIKDAKTNGYKKILVLEDDFIIINNFEHELTNLFTNVDDKWDFIYLGKKQGADNLSIATYDKIHTNKELYLIQDINDYVYKPNYKTWGTHAILIKNTLFDEIIDFSKNIQGPIDLMLMKLYSKYNFYCVKKDLFISYEETSDVQTNIKTNYEKEKQLWNWNYSLYQKVETCLIKNIIIIGFKTPSHTHHYIHNMYYRFFKYYYPNLNIYWYDNGETIDEKIAKYSIVFCSPSHIEYTNIPVFNNNIFYILHIDFCDIKLCDTNFSKKNMRFLNDSNTREIVISKNYINLLCREILTPKNKKFKYFDTEIVEQTICLPWFSNDLYTEIIKIKTNLFNIYENNNKKKYLCYMGSIWPLNINIIKRLIKFCIDNKVLLLLKGRTFDLIPDDFEYIKYIVKSSTYIKYDNFNFENNGDNIENTFHYIDNQYGIKGLLPLQGDLQNNNYLSNRVFETLTRGYLVITNNAKTKEYYKSAIYNENIELLLQNYLEILKDKNLWISLMYQQIDEFLNKFYGYHNINNIRCFLKNVSGKNNKLIKFYDNNKLFTLQFIKEKNEKDITITKNDENLIKTNENIRNALSKLNNYIVYNNVNYDIFLIEQLISCENYDILIDSLYKKKGFIINLCEKYKKSYTIINNYNCK